MSIKVILFHCIIVIQLILLITYLLYSTAPQVFAILDDCIKTAIYMSTVYAPSTMYIVPTLDGRHCMKCFL